MCGVSYNTFRTSLYDVFRSSSPPFAHGNLSTVFFFSEKNSREKEKEEEEEKEREKEREKEKEKEKERERKRKRLKEPKA